MSVKRPPLESFFSPIQKEDIEDPREKASKDMWEMLRGAPGKKGKDADPKEVAEIVIEHPKFVKKINSIKPNDGKTPVKGEDYFTEDDKEQLITTLLDQIELPKGEKGDKGEDAEIDEDELLEKLLTNLRDPKSKKRLGIKHIDGLEKYMADNINAIHSFYKGYFVNGTGSGVGGASGSGVVKTIVAGANITVDSTDPANPIVAATSGGSFSILVPTGTVDGTNRTFVFTSTPSVIVVDDTNVMNKTRKDTQANWTGTATVTMTVAPTGNIFGY